jgi:hypothetical protein
MGIETLLADASECHEGTRPNPFGHGVQREDHSGHLGGYTVIEEPLVVAKSVLGHSLQAPREVVTVPEYSAATLLNVLSASSEFLGNIELRLTIDVPTAHLIPTKAYLMLNELPRHEEWCLDSEGCKAVSEG